MKAVRGIRTRSKASLRRRLALILPLAAMLIGVSGEAASPAANALIERRDGYVEGCGAMIYYESIGRGPAVMILHGGPGDSHNYFLPYLLPLAQRHRLIFIDERGSGRSQRLADRTQYTLEAMACDVEATRRALKSGPTDVLGHSFGGILAQEYAIRYPASIRRLILASTGSSAARLNADFAAIKQGLDPVLRAQIEALEAKGIIGEDGAQLPEYRKLADQAELPFNYSVRPPAWSEPGESIGWDVLNEMWGDKSDFHIDGNLTGFDFVPKLQALSITTLIIAGDHDLPTQATLEETHAALRNSRVVVLAHSGHMTFVDQTAAFLGAVETFLGP
jgi:proline iminopeptidase